MLLITKENTQTTDICLFLCSHTKYLTFKSEVFYLVQTISSDSHRFPYHPFTSRSTSRVPPGWCVSHIFCCENESPTVDLPL